MHLVATCEVIQEVFGFRILLPGFRIPLPGFQIPLPGFRIILPGFRIPLPGLWIPLPGFWIPLPGFRIPLPGFWIPKLIKGRIPDYLTWGDACMRMWANFEIRDPRRTCTV